MKKIKFITALLVTAMLLQIFAVTASAKLVVGVSGIPEAGANANGTQSADEGFKQPLSIPTENVEGNLLARSSFDNEDCLDFWSPMVGGMVIEWHEDENGGYVRTDQIPVNYYGFRFTPETEVGAGIYKFTGYFRTYNEDEITNLRVEFVNYLGTDMKTLNVNCTNEWQKVEYYVTLDGALQHINVCGGPYVEFFQDYCMDEFSLVAVNSIPDGANKTDIFGDPVDREKAAEITYAKTGTSTTYDPETYLAKYKVNGIMMNNDADGTLYGIGRDPSAVSVTALKNAIMQYKDTHVTDFMLTVCNEIATYPSLVWTSYLDKYYQTEENGVAVDYKNADPCAGAYHVWETLGTDYIGLWAEILPTIGINPWLTFRMNDIHDRYLSTSFLLSDFYHENPEFRRITHRDDYPNMGNAYDYTHREVRDHYLALVNEALGRYDVYGIEFDFQREAFLWYLGGEYNGLDIFNEYMREIDDVIKVYEEKYGHEIKFAVRVPPDPTICYELGMDITTWAAEGIIDHVTATGRFECTEFDIPIRLWKSMLSPYGVTIAAGIDTAYIRHNGTTDSAGWSGELYAGFCANAYSQGADKIYMHNMNTPANLQFSESEKITIGNETNVPFGRWGFITTCGSYDKVIEMNRRCTLAFNDTVPVWRNWTYSLPVSISKNNSPTVRIPVGDITVGSEVTFDFSLPDNWLRSDDALERAGRFEVYINSYPCEFLGIYDTRSSGGGVFTTNKVLRWKVPVEAQEDVYMIAQIVNNGKGSCNIDHMEVYIDPNPEA